jgi:hypothetical protein
MFNYQIHHVSLPKFIIMNMFVGNVYKTKIIVIVVTTSFHMERKLYILPILISCLCISQHFKGFNCYPY